MIGTTLSHYEITAELGRGGMGIVYRARDTKLDRDVAIKVLPAAALASEDDRARFYREAKAAAALNHPNIAQIYQIDEAVPSGYAADDHRPFIAMELIDGGTLEDRVKEGPLSLEEAVRIASEATDGLKMAHEKDIVHRDVKSANIMLTAGGRVKILDFGLAKTAQSTMLTRMGSTLGTVAYMSPEQARGEEVDHRSDIWALGVILYEMIAGRNPFGGDYEQAVVYSILNEGVEPLTALRTGVPMSLEWIVSKCLAKDAGDRYQSAQDLLVDLRNVDLSGSAVLRSTSSRTVSQPILPAAKPASGPDWKMAVLGLGLGLLLAGIPWLLSSSSSSHSPAAVRSQIVLPEGMTLEPGKSAPLALNRTGYVLTPDGSMLIVVASFGETTALYRREMDSDRFELIQGTEDAYGLAMSPDGMRVAFYANNLLKTIDIDGGSARDITPVSLPYDMVWLPDGRILFTNDEGSALVIVDEDGRNRQTVFLRRAEDPDTELLDRIFPREVLPNGNVIAWGSGGTFEIDLDEGVARLIDSVSFRTYSGTGASLFIDGSGLSLGTWDGASEGPRGATVTLTDSLYRQSGLRAAPYRTDERGTVLFSKGPDLSLMQFNWLEEGDTDTTPLAGTTKERYLAFRISPDGNSVVVPIGSVDGYSLWAIDLVRGVRTVLSPAGNINNPVWSPDGEYVYWGSYNGRHDVVLRRALNGTADADTVYALPSHPEWVTPDGRYLGIIRLTNEGMGDLGMIDLQDPSQYVPIAAREDATEVLSRLSNGGGYVAYTSSETGDYQVFVQTVPPSGRSWQVSIEGGEEPLWSANDDTIYWRNGDELLSSSITYSNGVPSFSTPTVVFDGTFENVPGYSIDISPIDGRILMARSDRVEQGLNRIEMITNYPALLEKE